MFSSHEHLVKRSGKKGVDRPQFLKELVEEFLTAEHLGNFCFYKFECWLYT